MNNTKITPPELEKYPFGICPFCGHALGWSSDEPWVEDEMVTIRYLNCQHCGATVEAMECPQESRNEYPDYWNNES